MYQSNLRGGAYFGRAYKKGLCPVAEEILATSVRININEGFREDEVDAVINAIKKVAAWYNANPEL